MSSAGQRLRLTTFAGAYPQRGSRSLTTDYPTLRALGGSETGRLIPVAGGADAGPGIPCLGEIQHRDWRHERTDQTRRTYGLEREPIRAWLQ